MSSDFSSETIGSEGSSITTSSGISFAESNEFNRLENTSNLF